MKYVCRPGIVLTKICGQWLLVPTRKASESCPNIIKLTLPAVIIWKMMEKEKTEEDMQRALAILTHKDRDNSEMFVRNIVETFVERGLLIPCEGDT